MSATDLAGARYTVRYGELTFGERVLDAFAAMGVDAFGGIATAQPSVSPCAVVEIVDRLTGCVVSRSLEGREAAELLHDAIFVDLHRLCTATFDARGGLEPDG
jgi:hypothetical protein